MNSVHDDDGDDAHLMMMMMIEIHIKYNINYSKKRLDNYENNEKCNCKNNCDPLTEPLHLTRICMKNLQSKCKLSVLNNGNGSFCSEITYNLLTQVQLEEWA